MQDSGVYLNDLGCFFVHIFSLESEFAFIAHRVLRNISTCAGITVHECWNALITGIMKSCTHYKEKSHRKEYVELFWVTKWCKCCSSCCHVCANCNCTPLQIQWSLCSTSWVKVWSWILTYKFRMYKMLLDMRVNLFILSGPSGIVFTCLLVYTSFWSFSAPQS